MGVACIYAGDVVLGDLVGLLVDLTAGLLGSSRLTVLQLPPGGVARKLKTQMGRVTSCFLFHYKGVIPMRDSFK